MQLFPKGSTIPGGLGFVSPVIPSLSSSFNTMSTGGGAKMAEEEDGEITFSPTNPSKEQQNGEQSLQNNFWSLAADIRRPERQAIVFEGRYDKNIKD